MYPYSTSEYIDMKLRIQGYEVPFLGARVSFGVNLPSTATIQIIPTGVAKRIRAGMRVHLFYRDHVASMISGVEINRVLFEGEIHGKSFSRTEGARAINLSCIDFANYYINANQYLLNFQTTQFVASADIAVFAGVNKIQGQLLGNKARISQFFSQDKDESFDKVVERIIGDVRNVNRFFSYNLDLYKLVERIFSGSNAEMAKAIFNHDVAIDVLRQQINKSGGVQSLWKTISQMLSMVHHEIVSMSSPSYLPTTEFRGVESAPVYWTQGDVRDISRDAVNLQVKSGHAYRPGNFLIKPNAWQLEPPQCNIIYANEVTALNYQVNWQNKITRLQLIPNNPIVKGRNPLNILSAVYQPYALQEYVRSNYGKVSSKSGAGGISKGTKLRQFDFLSNEEIERGIVAGFSTILPGATAFLLSHSARNVAKRKGAGKSDSVQNEDLSTFTQRLAEFEFHRKRAGANQLQIQCAFKPHIAPGYPCLFIDDSDLNLDVMAYVQGGSHMISAGGSVTTSLQLALARDLSEEEPDLNRMASGTTVSDAVVQQTLNTASTGSPGNLPQSPSEPPLPAWFDDAYTYGKVGPRVYSKTLGCSGLLQVGNNSKDEVTFDLPRNPIVQLGKGRAVDNPELLQQHLQEVRRKMNVSIDSLRGEYQAARDAGEHVMFTYMKTFRPIVTEEQLLIDTYDGKLTGAMSLHSSSVYTGDIRTNHVKADIFGNDPSQTAKKSDIAGHGYVKPNSASTGDPSPGISSGGFSLKLFYPLPGRPVGIDFGKTRNPKKAGFRFHAGLDIHAPKGTAVFPAAIGVVVKSVADNGATSSTGGYGNYVIVQHKSSSIDYFTLYAHLDKTIAKLKDKVNTSAPIGTCGKSGNAGGYHLHFELRRGKNERSSAIDSIPYFTNSPRPLYFRNAIRRSEQTVISRVSATKSTKQLLGTSNTPSLHDKTGANFLHFAQVFGRGKPYVFGAAGPNAFDSPGLPFYVAKQFSVNLRRAPVDMFTFSMREIPVSEALKIPGALLFEFRNIGNPRKRSIRHVGISFGDGKNTWEAYNVRHGVRKFKRGNVRVWTNAGIIPGFTYGAFTVPEVKSLSNTPFAEYFSTYDKRLQLIQDNRIAIAKAYQDELASHFAFTG